LLEKNPTDTGMLGLMGDALMAIGKCDEVEQTYRRMGRWGAR
jgi:hypothetical protein